MAIITKAVNLGHRLAASADKLGRAMPHSRNDLSDFIREKIDLAIQSRALELPYEAARTAASLLDSGKVVLTASEGWQYRPVESLADLHQAYPLLRFMPETLVREIGDYLPPAALSFKLFDQRNGYTCYQLPITPKNIDRIEQARSLVIKAMEKRGYKGFALDIDRKYDPNSSYFVVENLDSEIVAAGRMTFKSASRNMPVEDGLKEDGARYDLQGQAGKISEINSFYCKRSDRRSLFVLYAAFGRFAYINNFNKVICLVDERNERLHWLYSKAGFKYSEQYSDRISFPTFGQIKFDQFRPTSWRVMEMNRYMVMLHALRSLQYFDKP